MEEALGKACILLLDLPQSTFCGVDLLSFNTSSRFKGFRQVPKGWHFLFTGANAGFSLRHGVWIRIKGDSALGPEVIAKKWDRQHEELVAEKDETASLRLRANLGSIWREGLAPYRQTASNANSENFAAAEEEAHDWEQLTDRISEKLLTRITGDSGLENHWTLNSASSAPKDADVIPGLTEKEYEQFREKDLNFLPVNLSKTWRDGAIGRERTEAAQDRSWALGDMIAQNCAGNPYEVIGELQFTFLMILTLNNNSCMEQWKRLLSMLLTCKAAVPRMSAFFVRVLTLLRMQLEHCQDAEGGLFDMSDDEGNLLKSLLMKFRKGLTEQSGEGKIAVMDELDELEEYLNAEHGWYMNGSQLRRGTHLLEDGEEVELEMSGFDEDEELGEYAPTVVDLTPEQASQLDHQVGPQLTFNTKRASPNENSELTMKRAAADNVREDDEEELQDLDSMDARF